MRLLLFSLSLLLSLSLFVLGKEYYELKDAYEGLAKKSYSSNKLSQGLANDIKVFFSPKKGAEKAIVDAINDAQKEILVAAYSFTSKNIAKSLLIAKRRGIDVRIILDKSQETQKYSSKSFFTNMGFNLKVDDKHAIFHNKYMIIDSHMVITGSYNFTNSAEIRNAENIVIISNDSNVVRKYKEDWQHHWNHSKN